jgi:hypothetical protein
MSNGEPGPEPEQLPLLPRLITSTLGEEKAVCDEGGESMTGGVGGAGYRSESDSTMLVFALTPLLMVESTRSRLACTSTLTREFKLELEWCREDLLDGTRDRTGVRTTGENGLAE